MPDQAASLRRTPDNSLRRGNAIVALVLVVFFFVHAILGSLFLGDVLPNALAWLVWIGVGVIAVHVALSCFTSVRQLNDERFPPSRRKKKHLALKWATGIILLICAAIHVFLPDFSEILFVVFTTLVLAALTWHVVVCSKSLLKDLGAQTRWRLAVNIAIFVLAVMVEIALLLAAVGR